MDRGPSFIELSEARAWVAALVTGSVVLLVGRDLGAPSQVSGDKAANCIALIVIFGLSLGTTNAVGFFAVSVLPVGVAVVIAYLAPPLVVLWIWGVRGEPPTNPVVVGLALATLGIALLSGFYQALGGSHSSLSATGLLAALLQAFSYAAVILSGERLSRSIGASRTVFFGYGVAGTVWLLFQFTSGQPVTVFRLTTLPGILYLGVVGTVLPYLLFCWGMRYVDARIASIMATLEVVVATAVAFFWLKQSLSSAQLVGGAMVLAGAVVVSVWGARRATAN